MRFSRAGIGLFAMAVLSSSCTGAIGPEGGGEPGSDPAPGPGGGTPGGPGMMPPGGGSPGTGTPPGGGAPGVVPGAPAPGQLRRLSAAQFRRALGDLLGPTASLPAIEESPASASLRSIGSTITAVTPRGVELFETAIEAALDPAFADPRRRMALVGCAPAGAWDAACARGFLEGFGRRAWRRPLAPDEVTRYLKLGEDEARGSGQFADGARAMASALLQSANFLYRIELGGKPVAGKSWSRLAGHEVAARLSFLLWGTIPDPMLLAAADRGALDTPEGVRAEAQRLLASPRLADGLTDLVDDVLALDAVHIMAKDPKLYPQLTATLREALRLEIVKLFEDVVVKRDGDVLELLDTDRTFVNEELGKLYGIRVTGTALVEARHPAGVPRAGLVTAAGLLSVHDKQHQTSPTRRGAFVRNTYLCEHIPDPPPSVDASIKPPPAGVVISRRDLLRQHFEDPSCAGCHQLTDPVGFALENFDALGLHRTREENGLPIDPSGELDGQRFAGPRELAAHLRASPKVRDCLVRWVYRFATGHEENQYDEAQIKALAQGFATSGQRLRALLGNLVVNDGFVNVSPVRK